MFIELYYDFLSYLMFLSPHALVRPYNMYECKLGDCCFDIFVIRNVLPSCAILNLNLSRARDHEDRDLELSTCFGQD